MFRTIFASLALLIGACTLKAAEVTVELQATPPAAGGEFYQPGEVVTVDVWYQNQTALELRLRMLRFSTLAMAAAEQAGFVTGLEYDLTSLGAYTWYYETYPAWPQPSAVYANPCDPPYLMLTLPPTGTFHVGTFTYALGDHDVLLDIINTGGTDPDLTGRILANFDPPVDLNVGNGKLGDGTPPAAGDSRAGELGAVGYWLRAGPAASAELSACPVLAQQGRGTQTYS